MQPMGDAVARETLIEQLAADIRALKPLQRDAILAFGITHNLPYVEATRIYKAAWSRVKSEQLSKDDLTWLVSAMYMNIYEEARADKDRRSALTSLDSICKLHGLNAPVRNENVNIDCKGKSEAELKEIAVNAWEDIKKLTAE